MTGPGSDYMFRGFLFFLLLSQASIALARNELCWIKEENPTTKQPYSSYGQWESDVDSWQKLQKPQLNVARLMTAFKTYKQEKGKADSFGNDKMAHCYVGCRISQATDFKTARFVAWFKEIQDLTDCKMDSHFELHDYDATILGAEAGKSKAHNCEAVCPDLIKDL